MEIVLAAGRIAQADSPPPRTFRRQVSGFRLLALCQWRCHRLALVAVRTDLVSSRSASNRATTRNYRRFSTLRTSASLRLILASFKQSRQWNALWRSPVWSFDIGCARKPRLKPKTNVPDYLYPSVCHDPGSLIEFIKSLEGKLSAGAASQRPCAKPSR
jgi:hypothetical protein